MRTPCPSSPWNQEGEGQVAVGDGPLAGRGQEVAGSGLGV